VQPHVSVFLTRYVHISPRANIIVMSADPRLWGRVALCEDEFGIKVG
jgi:hypothetical protein